MKDWDSLPLKEYIKQKAAKTGPLIFQHIPKTAGSSLVHEINQNIGGYYPIVVDYSATKADVPMDEKFMIAVEVFLKSYDPERLRSASGHIRRKHVERILEVIPDAKLVTVLRHPVDRVISDYRYQCTDQHPPHKQFVAQYPTIEDYVANPGTGEKMWHFMLRHDMTVKEGIALIESRYDFIGTQDMYDMSVNIMMLLAGRDVMPTARVRTTKNVAENQFEVTDELRALIEKMNPRDMAIYTHFREKLAAKADEWRKMKQDVNAMRVLAYVPERPRGPRVYRPAVAVKADQRAHIEQHGIKLDAGE